MSITSIAARIERNRGISDLSADTSPEPEHVPDPLSRPDYPGFEAGFGVP